MRQLLESGHAVLARVEARLHQPQREGRQREHLPAPSDGCVLELGERDDRVDEPHRERLFGVVLPAKEPDLLRLLRANEARQEGRAVAAVERSDARADLAEARVVGGDREVTHEVQHLASTDGVARDHRHDGLGKPADLHVQVGDVEAPDARPLLE